MDSNFKNDYFYEIEKIYKEIQPAIKKRLQSLKMFLKMEMTDLSIVSFLFVF